MKRPRLVGSILASLLFLAAGLDGYSTTFEFNTSVSTISQLVSVNADLTFPPLVPGAQYDKNMAVTWALAPQSLQGINTDHVTVHVLVFADSDSWLVFYGSNGQRFGSYAFDLDCHVQNGTCLNDSHLTQTIPIELDVPNNASSHSERVWVQASLVDSYSSMPLDNHLDGFSQTIQSVLQHWPLQPVAQFFQPFNPTPKPIAPSLKTSSPSIAAQNSNLALSNAQNSISSDAAGSSNTQTGSNVQTGNQQTALQPPPSSGANGFILGGFAVAKSDAVFYGGLVVFVLLAFLFYRHFFNRKTKGNGMFET